MTTNTPSLTSAQGALLLPQRLPTRAPTWTGFTEWYTPPHILEAARDVLGAIDLDPASSNAQQQRAPVKAAQYYTLLDNGLERSWQGRVWLNPPYARGWIDLFVAKMVSAYHSGDMQAGILLTNASTETKWWQAAAEACDAVCFPRGRIRFLKLDQNDVLTSGKSAPSHPHSLFYFGSDAARFTRGFQPLGLIFPKPTSPARQGRQPGARVPKTKK